MPTKKNKREWNTILISTIRNAPHEFSIERGTNVQGKLQFSFMWSVRLVPTKPVGKAHPKNRYASETTTEGKHST